MNNLENFLQTYLAKNDDLKQDLFLFHTCIFQKARSYIHNQKIETEDCKNFGGDLLYLFLGKPRYSDASSPQEKRKFRYRPVCFVLKPNTIIKPERIYPFDTGAAKAGLYAPHFLAENFDTIKEEFLIGQDLKIAYSLISLFFQSNNDYICEKLVPANPLLDQNQHIFELGELNNLYRSTDNGADGRKATIEIQNIESIELNSLSLTYVVAPAALLTYPELDTLISKCNAEFLPYPDGLMDLNYDSYVTLRSLVLTKLSEL